MKTRLPIEFFVIFVLILCLPGEFIFDACASQINFVQQPAPTRPQGQNQQGLPPEKKTKLPNYGPEDVFPGAREQDNKSKQTNQAAKKTASRPAAPTPTLKPIPSPSSSPRSEPTPSVSPSVTPTVNEVTSTPVPSPTLPKEAANLQQQPESSSDTEKLALKLALALAFVWVLGALIYVVAKLKQKL